MIELLKKIFQITLDLERAINEEQYEEFENLLQIRLAAMSEVDEYKANHAGKNYSDNEKQILRDIVQLNQMITKKTEELHNQIQQSMNKVNADKQLYKYKPYFKQTSGIFVDEILGKKR
ncbi:hypothetical protein [Pseudoneobacillus sp. C159]